jgi:hypothetical protein
VAGRRAGAGLALAAVALSAAGCGLGGSTKTVTVVRTHTVTVTVTRTITTTPTVPSDGGPAAACVGSQLSGSFIVVAGSQGAGQISYVLKLTNISQDSCFVSGLPDAQLLTAKTAPLPTNVVAAGSSSGPKVVVAPGTSAVADARFSPSVPGQGDSQSGNCQPRAAKLGVSPDGGGATVYAPITPPTSVCERGTLNFNVYSAAS